MDLLPARRPLRVLDLGCSTCEEGEALLGAGVHLTCVDRDAVTLAQTAKRLEGASFAAVDAARFEPADGERFDVVLMRRPDVALQQHGWHAAFERIPQWIAPEGRVVVTTPGALEARMVRSWLEELGAKRIEETMIERNDERFALVAEGIEAKEKAPRPQGPADALAWEDGAPHMVCDVRTGRCTMVGTLENQD